MGTLEQRLASFILKHSDSLDRFFRGRYGPFSDTARDLQDLVKEIESQTEHWSTPDGCLDGCPVCKREGNSNE